jgi:hypothetical protein
MLHLQFVVIEHLPKTFPKPYNVFSSKYAFRDTVTVDLDGLELGVLISIKLIKWSHRSEIKVPAKPRWLGLILVSM